MSDALGAVTFEDYLEAEQHSEVRHEFVGGLLYLHAGGTERHDLAAAQLLELVAPGARTAGCRAFMHRMLQTPDGNAYYPDVMVSCGRPPSLLFEGDAALIFEILSPSTRAIDRREKAIAYAQLPSLELYALVYPDQCRIEVARPRGGTIKSWEALGPEQVLFTPFGDLSLDAFYDTLERSAPG